MLSKYVENAVDSFDTKISSIASHMGHTEYSDEEVPKEENGIRVISTKDPQKEMYLGTNRNDPCPCGSGKKFKQCHGKS